MDLINKTCTFGKIIYARTFHNKCDVISQHRETTTDLVRYIMLLFAYHVHSKSHSCQYCIIYICRDHHKSHYR